MVTSGDDESFGINKPATLACLGQGKALRLQHSGNLVGYPQPGFTGSEEQHALVGQLTAGESQAGEHAGQGDRAGPLNIVIKGAGAVAVVL